MGFFSIDRDLLEHEIWLSEPFTKGQAWVDLIGLANHEDFEQLFQGIKLNCKRGYVNRSKRNLARRWKWSPGKVTRFLNLLETEQMIEQQTEQGETAIKLVNYDKWQTKYIKNGTHQRTLVETSTEHQRNTNNKVNKVNQPIHINSNNKFKNEPQDGIKILQEEHERFMRLRRELNG